MTPPPPLPATEDPRDAVFDVSQLGKIGRLTGKSASVVLVYSALRLFLTLGTTAALARLVSPAEHGLVAYVLPVVLLATGLSEFGLAQAVVQRPKITHRVVSALFWVNLGLGLFLTGIAFLLGPVAATFYSEPRVTPILFALAPYILLSVLSVHYVAILRRRMQVQLAETCNVAGVVVAAIAAITAALLGAGPWALVIQLIASQAASLLFLFLAVRWLPSAPWRSALGEAGAELRFGGYLSAERLLNELVVNLQLVIVGRAFGSVEVGLIHRSNTFAKMPQKRIVSPLSGAFIPSLSRLQDDPQQFRDMYGRQLSRGNLILVPIGLLMILAPDALVLVLLGPDWSAAASIMGWLGLSALHTLFSSCNSWVMVASGRPKELFFWRILTAGMVVATMIVGVQFGLQVFVAAIALLHIGVIAPVTALVAIRYTPLDGRTVLQAILPDAIFCIVIASACVAMRGYLDYGILMEGFLTGLLICAAQGLRILAVPNYRSDVLKVFKRG